MLHFLLLDGLLQLLCGLDVPTELWYWAMILSLAENLKILEVQFGHGLGSYVCFDDVAINGAICCSECLPPVSCCNMLSSNQLDRTDSWLRLFTQISCY
ncbi:hypothetical protein Nepgr_026042 [Nepenthes gracilis]|uniref:Secreted protein n=1 Tax=Nepenthes gracilis TaxID=150966 RepID=A0AAD3T843_NEPGR|nr:hypothetical protein Nepgr_026042 [Nepenthes gracilis]